MYKQLNCTITMIVVVVIITDNKLMFSLHSQLASDSDPRLWEREPQNAR